MAHWRMSGGRCRCVPRQQQHRKQTRYDEESDRKIRTGIFSRDDGIIAVVVLLLALRTAGHWWQSVFRVLRPTSARSGRVVPCTNQHPRHLLFVLRSCLSLPPIESSHCSLSPAHLSLHHSTRSRPTRPYSHHTPTAATTPLSPTPLPLRSLLSTPTTDLLCACYRPLIRPAHPHARYPHRRPPSFCATGRLTLRLCDRACPFPETRQLHAFHRPPAQVTRSATALLLPQQSQRLADHLRGLASKHATHLQPRRATT